jgi:superfamily II DNA helicase RecQ
MTSNEVSKLWKIPKFTKKILAFVFDEAHCITQWGVFRKNYLSLGLLRHLIPDPVPFYVASATLPKPLITEIARLLHLQPNNNTMRVLCSNDRPDISLAVKALVYPANSFKDLDFLIPWNWNEDMGPPAKFLVFLDNIKEVEGATKHLRSRLQRKYHNRVDWFHGTMSQEFREEAVGRLRSGMVWGLVCTDAFGMVSSSCIQSEGRLTSSQGMDIPDVQVVVQYKATCEFCTLWQRFGRAAQGPGQQGVGLLLVEHKDICNDKTPKKRTNSSKEVGPLKKKKPNSKPTLGGEEENVCVDEEMCKGSEVAVPTPVDPDRDLEAWVADCRERYRKPTLVPSDPTNAKKGKSPGVLPGSPLDNFINPPDCVKCRRLIPQIYFSNDSRSTLFIYIHQQVY